MLTADVRQLNGAPALFINGQPDTGLMFWTPDVLSPENRRCVSEFRDAGVHLFSCHLSMGSAVTAPGHYNFCHFDDQMRAILETDPGALVMPRLDLTPSDKWLDENPDERMVHFDPASGKFSNRGGARVSFSSRKWRDLMLPALRAFIRHAEEQHGEHVAGYHIGGGDCGEWSYIWADYLSDFSNPQQEAFRTFLRARYSGSDSSLRSAWQDSNITLATAVIPQDRMLSRTGHSVLDPVVDKRIVDYQEFHSEAVADAILDFCGAARAELRSMNRSKILAVFYGYHFWFLGFACGYHNSGHHSLLKVLESPDVDILCAPGNYHDRHPGGFFSSQLIAGSVRLHGKLFYNEDDTRTHMTSPDSAWGRCPDLKTSIGVLRRNLIGTFISGGTNWWMDQSGRGWYSDKLLLADLSAQRELAGNMLRGDRSSTPQVAVIVSQETARFMRYDGALTDSALIRQLTELGAMGTPFEVYDATDLDTLFRRPDAKRFRLVIFLNCLYLSPGERRAIRDHVAIEGRTLLWSHAGGIVTEKGISTEAMADVTGIKVGVYPRSWPLEVASYFTGERLMYGVQQPVTPVLYGIDPDATVRGWIRLHTHKDTDMPGLLDKDCGSWRSIWSAAPALPAQLLREIARSSGVHIFTNNGDQIFTAPGLLAVHAAFDGARTISLPAPAKLKDVFTGKSLDATTGTIDITMRRGDTFVWTY